YITVCSLIYSQGGPIPDDDRWLAAKSGLHKRTIRAAVSSLVRQGKVVSTTLDGRPSLMVNRCRAELERALSRISGASEKAAKRWKNREDADAAASAGADASARDIINHQPSTINHQERKREGRTQRDPRSLRLPDNFAVTIEWLQLGTEARAKHNLPP